jgi:hypothetical protein
LSKDKPKTKTTIKNAREKPDNKKKSSGGSVLRDVMVYPIIIALAFAFIAPLVTYFISGRHAVLYATAFGISVLLFLGAHALNTYLDERNGGGPTSASQNRKSLQSPMDRESAPPRFRLVAHAEFKDVGIHTPYANFMALFTLNGFETLSPIDAIYELTLINLQKTPAIIDWYTLSCNPSGDDT